MGSRAIGPDCRGSRVLFSRYHRSFANNPGPRTTRCPPSSSNMPAGWYRLQRIRRAPLRTSTTTPSRSSLIMSVDTMSQSRVVDPDRPWLGLQHFEEATRDYFFGRDVEQRDLLERVQHRPL